MSNEPRRPCSSSRTGAAYYHSRVRASSLLVVRGSNYTPPEDECMHAAHRLECLRRIYGILPRLTSIFCLVCGNSRRHRRPVLGLHGADVERAAPREEKVQLQHSDANARRNYGILVCRSLLRRGKYDLPQEVSYYTTSYHSKYGEHLCCRFLTR